MSRLVDADAITSSNELATKIVSHNLTPYIKVDDLIDFIDRLPTIEAVGVVHGEIITVFEKAIGHQRCSVCGNELEWKAYPNYCDNCGVKLKGGAE